MGNELSRTYTAADGQELTLTPESVARYILGGGAENVPESEYAKVIMTCAARGLNPLAGDVAIQPRQDKRSGMTTLTVVPTKDYFQRRAEAHPSYRGKAYGIVVYNAHENRIIHKRGTGFYPALGEQLLGGWCSVQVEGHEKPEYAEVSRAEYDTGYALWKSKPATMIAKVAKSQALREAFTSEFQGLYEPEELGIPTDASGEVVAQVQAPAVRIEGEETLTVPIYVEESIGEQDASEYASDYLPVEAMEQSADEMKEF